MTYTQYVDDWEVPWLWASLLPKQDHTNQGPTANNKNMICESIKIISKYTWAYVCINSFIFICHAILLWIQLYVYHAAMGTYMVVYDEYLLNIWQSTKYSNHARTLSLVCVELLAALKVWLHYGFLHLNWVCVVSVLFWLVYNYYSRNCIHL